MTKYILSFLLLLLTITAVADEPQGLPQYYEVFSPDKNVRAEVDPFNGIKTTNMKDGGKVLWRHPKWLRQIYLSNDGVTWVAINGGGSLLSSNSKENIVFTIWNKDQKLKDVLVKDLKTELKKTASHYYWGDGVGFDENNDFKVKLSNDSTEVFSTKKVEPDKLNPKL